MSTEWANICLGRLSKDEAANIAREIRYLWRYLEDVQPNGDRKKVAQLKVTIDEFGQYHFYLNQQALRYLLLLAKNIPNPNPTPTSKQATELPDCPPEVPDFLRWDGSAGSKPE